jgi:hypothetical protein
MSTAHGSSRVRYCVADMPVILVTAPALDSTTDEVRALAGVATEVADALGLTPEDVQVSCMHSAIGVLGTRVVAPWPIVVIHGRRRPEDQATQAMRRAKKIVAAAWKRAQDEIWIEWSES